MEQAHTQVETNPIIESPVRSGVILGIIVGLADWYLVPGLDSLTLGVGFLTVGILLTLWADEWWPQFGRGLTSLGGILVFFLFLGEFIPDFLTAI